MADRQFTRAEVQARNQLGNAAIIIDNVVYEVTEFLEEHPGGAEVLMDNAGKDASQCFSNVGHSDIALEWREKFRVGEVVEAERRPPARPRLAEASGASGASGAAEASLAGLLAVWAPPAALAAGAALLYNVLFQ